MTSRKPLVYVAGPYSLPDPVENTHRAVRVGMSLYDEAGVAVLIPHVSLVAHLIDPRDITYWYQFDLDQLAHCDALYRIDGPSTGADDEVRFAHEHGIPVFTDSQALAVWAEAWRAREAV